MNLFHYLIFIILFIVGSSKQSFILFYRTAASNHFGKIIAVGTTDFFVEATTGCDAGLGLHAILVQ